MTHPTPADPTSTYACKYDAWNRLTEVSDGGTVIGTYEYDGLHRRIVKHYDTDDSGGADTYRHFFYDGWQVVEMRSSASSGEPENFQPEYQYVWSERYVDSPVCRDENTDADGLCDDEHLYYLTDANYNVTAVVDDGGTVQERYAYDPYGRVSIFDASWSDRTGSAHDVSVLYCGYYRDAETELYHVRRRTYHPALGWLQRDPLGYVDGANLYEYCGLMPLICLDPMGMDKKDEYGNTDQDYDTYWKEAGLPFPAVRGMGREAADALLEEARERRERERQRQEDRRRAREQGLFDNPVTRAAVEATGEAVERSGSPDGTLPSDTQQAPAEKQYERTMLDTMEHGVEIRREPRDYERHRLRQPDGEDRPSGAERPSGEQAPNGEPTPGSEQSPGGQLPDGEVCG